MWEPFFRRQWRALDLDVTAERAPWHQIEVSEAAREIVMRDGMLVAHCPGCDAKRPMGGLPIIEAVRVGDLLFDPQDTLHPGRTNKRLTLRLSRRDLASHAGTVALFVAQCPDCAGVVWSVQIPAATR